MSDLTEKTSEVSWPPANWEKLPVKQRARRLKQRFHQSDGVLSERAKGFWGFTVVEQTTESHFRTLHAAMKAVTDLDPESGRWLTDFEIHRTIEKGKTAMKKEVVIEVPEAPEQPGGVISLRAVDGFRNPVVNEHLHDQWSEEGDAAAHIVIGLDAWRAQHERTTDEHRASIATRSLETFIFSVHGPKIEQGIKTFYPPDFENVA